MGCAITYVPVLKLTGSLWLAGPAAAMPMGTQQPPRSQHQRLLSSASGDYNSDRQLLRAHFQQQQLLSSAGGGCHGDRELPHAQQLIDVPGNLRLSTTTATGSCSGCPWRRSACACTLARSCRPLMQPPCAPGRTPWQPPPLLSLRAQVGGQACRMHARPDPEELRLLAEHICAPAACLPVAPPRSGTCCTGPQRCCAGQSRLQSSAAVLAV